jgi:hypothetical protein
MRGYRALLGLALAGALLVSLLVRLPRHARAVAPVVAPAPVTALALEFAAGRLVPESASVPKGHEIAFAITNRGREPVTLALAGYGDRVHAGPIAPGATWRGRFLADLPGEDFAWLPAGSTAPVGRLAVAGSHLVEGHR